MSEIAKLLEASLRIARLEKEAKMSAEAMRALREVLADRDTEIALLKATLNHANCRVRRTSQAGYETSERYRQDMKDSGRSHLLP